MAIRRYIKIKTWRERGVGTYHVVYQYIPSTKDLMGTVVSQINQPLPPATKKYKAVNDKTDRQDE